jgi:mannose-6-phosphate isomerase-like protein (cupin superfamily)
MADFIRRSFDAPDDSTRFPGARVDVVTVSGVAVRRLTVEPGWRWSESVGPRTGTDRCQLDHVVWIVVAGRFAVRMDDGTTEEFGPGDIGSIPPGHDAWVVGNDTVVGFDFLAGTIDRRVVD